MTPIYTVVIEGNIGSGKTTLVRKLQHSVPEFTVFPEPVEKWQNVVQDGQTVNLLKQFYEDPTTFAVPFQKEILRTYELLHRQQVATPFKVMERCIHSSEIFQEVLLADQILTQEQFHDLHQHKQALCSYDPMALHPNPFSPDLIIYLRTDPQTCLTRVRERMRSEEGGVTLDYLNKLHFTHDLYTCRASAPVCKINGGLSPSEVYRSVVTTIFTSYCTDRLAKYLHAH